MSASTDAAAGLKAVSSIRYKIANVSTDEKKLTAVLQTQLVPLLEKAGSPHKAVRDAAFQAYISVNNLIKPPGVILPVAALLEQYRKTSSPVVKQLDLGLVKKGLVRLDQAQRRELLPAVIKAVSKETNQTSASGFFVIFIRLLLEIKIPGRGTKDDLSLRDALGLNDSSDAKYIAQWLGKLFLLRQNLALALPGDLEKALATLPSGLTKDEVEFLRANDPKTWNLSEPGSLSLAECKVKAVNFLASGAFSDGERTLSIICASGSADSKITSVAEDVLKRSSVDLEDADVVKSLFDAHDRFPAAHRIQILKLLSKSVASCSMGTQVVQAVRSDFALTSGENAAASGLGALRLHKALLGFLTWIARNTSTTKKDQYMGPNLVLLLKDYILKQGWPDPTPAGNQAQFQDEQRLRAIAYETIGTLASGSLFEHKAKDSLLKWLFDSLVSDSSSDVVVHIESALSSMMDLFKTPHGSENRDLEILLLEYMTLPDKQGIRTTRHVAVRFANNCLPYHNIEARWISILALSGGFSGRRDVLEEGQKGLDYWWAIKLHPDDASKGLVVPPDWTKMTRRFFDATPREIGSDEMAVDQTSAYPLFPNDRIQAFPIAIKYVKQMLLLTALGETTVEIDWETQLENCIQNDLTTRSLIREYVSKVDQESLLKLLNAAFDGLRDHVDIGAEDCISCIAELLAFVPPSCVSKLTHRTTELLNLNKSNNQKVRQLASKAFGILAPGSQQSNSLISQLRDFLSSCKEPSAAQAAEYQGCLSFMGSYAYCGALYGHFQPPNTPDLMDIFDTSDHVDFLNGLFMSVSKILDQNIQGAAIEMMSQLWTVDMGFPTQPEDFKKTKDYLYTLAKSNNEKAITALGRLAVPEQAGTDTVLTILDTLFGLSDIKRTEVHFAIGEAIAAVISRWASTAVQLSVDVMPPGSGKIALEERLRKRSDQISTTLEKLITDCKTTKPSLLKASGIWLFCVIQYCSQLPEVQSKLRNCQVAFMRLLTARDELVQETASRGLALVYEKGDAALKDDLVKDLVSTFTGTKTQLKVDDDTELFDAGALPTGEGKSVTSYKDIISLANEVGDPSLIYKFMALATNAATWTARSAFGRFGLSNILSDAELDPKIYPKLYRYQYDPNPNVRRSMEDIWKAIVKDSTVVIDTHFDVIMNDLLKSIIDGREWRVREASCAAIAGLISGQPFPKYEKYYTDIWKLALKVLDDQKGSVRAAAVKLCMGLSKTLVTQLQENNSSASAKAMVSQVLPFLLSEKGIENSVDEVKYLAIHTVLEVVKNGGDTLKPFIPTIIIHCLGLLGTVEPEVVNYHYQRVGDEGREELDKLRRNAATRSPMFECIVDCLRLTDENTMKELAPQLAQTIKSALGMQTKVGCSEVLSTLALRHSILLPPYNATFLKIMETQVLDRNHEVSKAYARSSAYLLRTASADNRDRFTSRLSELYFAADDETRRQKIADVVLAIAKVSPDAFTDLEARLLPFSYLAKHDTDAYVSEEFEAAWSQHAGGNHTVMRFVDEISEFVSKGLNTSKWALQHGAALAVASMITALSNVVGKDGQFNDTNLQKIWPVLEKSLSLKTFKGKEKVVTSFPIFIKHSKKSWSTDGSIAAQTKKIAIREAKRNNNEYRTHAFEALAEFVAEREDVDMYQEVVSVVSEHLVPDSDTSKQGPTELERNTTAAALKAAMTAYNRAKMRSDSMAVLDEIISVIEKNSKATSIARDTWFTCAASVMKDATGAATAIKLTTSEQASTGTAIRWFRMLTGEGQDATEVGTSVVESQRTSRAKALLAFVDAWGRGVFGLSEDTLGEMSRRVAAMLEGERSLDVQKLLKQVARELGGGGS